MDTEGLFTMIHEVRHGVRSRLDAIIMAAISDSAADKEGEYFLYRGRAVDTPGSQGAAT